MLTDLITLVHLLLFCYWLGGDIGVFYASGFVADGSRTREQRLMAGKIMLALDLVPRICMSLMLTVGGILSELLGFEHPPWQLAAIVLLGPVWLGLVLVLHFKHGAGFIPRLTHLDRGLRWLIVVSVLGSVVIGVVDGSLSDAPWLAGKLLGFAFLVFCGLMIRAQFGGFANTYAVLATRQPTPQEDAAMLASLNRVRPWVLCIWLVLVVEAWLGVAQPVI